MATPKLQPVRGTHDILPEESRQRRFVVERFRTISECYGYGEISTPIFEFTEVFHRTLGDTSDVVSKETYSFTDRGGENITLRPEFTAAIARAVISNGMQDQLPLKLTYHGPAFRYERPQKGRYRQFHQIGAECLGVAEPVADVESISMAAQLLDSLGLLSHAKLQINSLGDVESRKNYRTALVAYFQDNRAALSADSLTRLERNPLRILDSKDEGDRKIVAGAPTLEGYFNAISQDFFAAVKEGLAALGVSFYVQPTLVRGLDYYSHTVFEFVPETPGAQATILAGGRYDGLLAMMGGPDTPGVGWAAGLERLIAMVDFSAMQDAVKNRRPIVMVPVGDACETPALKIAQDLRAQGFVVEMTYRGNLSKRMKRAEKLNAKAVLMLGEDEWKKGEVALRDYDKGTQTSVPINNLITYLADYRE